MNGLSMSTSVSMVDSGHAHVPVAAVETAWPKHMQMPDRVAQHGYRRRKKASPVGVVCASNRQHVWFVGLADCGGREARAMRSNVTARG